MSTKGASEKWRFWHETYPKRTKSDTNKHRRLRSLVCDKNLPGFRYRQTHRLTNSLFCARYPHITSRAPKARAKKIWQFLNAYKSRMHQNLLKSELMCISKRSTTTHFAEKWGWGDSPRRTQKMGRNQAFSTPIPAPNGRGEDPC